MLDFDYFSINDNYNHSRFYQSCLDSGKDTCRLLEEEYNGDNFFCINCIIPINGRFCLSCGYDPHYMGTKN